MRMLNDIDILLCWLNLFCRAFSKWPSPELASLLSQAQILRLLGTPWVRTVQLISMQLRIFIQGLQGLFKMTAQGLMKSVILKSWVWAPQFGRTGARHTYAATRGRATRGPAGSRSGPLQTQQEVLWFQKVRAAQPAPGH